MNDYIVICNTIRDANLLANRFVDWQTKIGCAPDRIFYKMGIFIVEFGISICNLDRFRFVPQSKMYEATKGFYGSYLNGYTLDKALDIIEDSAVPKCKEFDEVIDAWREKLRKEKEIGI
jgi:hypothetical protein